MAVQAPLPLGLILGQDVSTPGLTSVDEVAAGGNRDEAQVQRGDILHAITACQTTMETPTWQLIAGGIGQPKTKRFMYAVDDRPLEEVLEAVGSNRMDVQGRDVWLVLERLDEGSCEEKGIECVCGVCVDCGRGHTEAGCGSSL